MEKRGSVIRRKFIIFLSLWGHHLGCPVCMPLVSFASKQAAHKAFSRRARKSMRRPIRWSACPMQKSRPQGLHVRYAGLLHAPSALHFSPQPHLRCLCLAASHSRREHLRCLGGGRGYAYGTSFAGSFAVFGNQAWYGWLRGKHWRRCH